MYEHLHGQLRREARLFLGSRGTSISDVFPGISQDIFYYTAAGECKKSGSSVEETFRVHLYPDGSPQFIFVESTNQRVWRAWDEIPDAA